MSHPEADALAGLLEAVALWHEPFVHLLACPRCQAVATGVLDLVTRPEPAESVGRPVDYQPAFRRTSAVAKVLARAREVESAEAAELLRELLALPAADRGAALLTGERFRSLALAELLLDLARSHREQREELAGLAVLLLQGWPEPRQETCDLRAEARCELAEALRTAGHYETAERELVCAAADLRESTDALCRAAFCRALARLRYEQGRFDEAYALIDRAAELFEDGVDPVAQGEALITAGRWALGQGEPRRATARFDAALTLAELPAERCREALRDLVMSLLMDGRREEATLVLRSRAVSVGEGWAAVYRLMADRLESGDTDVAARHEEEQR